MFSSKKGEESIGLSYRTLISMVLVVEIFLSILLFVYTVSTGSRFEEHFLARDIATLIDTITVSPGNLVADYPRDTYKLAINIEKEKASVYKPNKLAIPIRESYPFSEDKGLVYEYQELVPADGRSVRPKFLKEGNKIRIIKEEYSTEGISKPVCIDIHKESLKAKGKLVDVIIEPINDLSVLENPQFGSNAKNADVVVVIIPGDELDETINPIDVYVHVDLPKYSESKYLGCLIINKILENEKLNKIISENSLTRFTSQRIQSTAKENINFGNIALLLEIGNRNIPKEKNILENREFNDLIKESINQAIDAYG